MAKIVLYTNIYVNTHCKFSFHHNEFIYISLMLLLGGWVVVLGGWWWLEREGGVRELKERGKKEGGVEERVRDLSNSSKG